MDEVSPEEEECIGGGKGKAKTYFQMRVRSAVMLEGSTVHGLARKKLRRETGIRYIAWRPAESLYLQRLLENIALSCSSWKSRMQMTVVKKMGVETCGVTCTGWPVS